jgi:hypothetical protein
MLLLSHGCAVARGGEGRSGSVGGVGNGRDDADRLLKAGRTRDTVTSMAAQKSRCRPPVLLSKRKRHH